MSAQTLRLGAGMAYLACGLIEVGLHRYILGVPTVAAGALFVVAWAMRRPRKRPAGE